MAEWLGEQETTNDELKEVNERIKGEFEQHVQDSVEYLKGDNGESE